jgi:hypothetical protein
MDGIIFLFGMIHGGSTFQGNSSQTDPKTSNTERIIEGKKKKHWHCPINKE